MIYGKFPRVFRTLQSDVVRQDNIVLKENETLTDRKNIKNKNEPRGILKIFFKLPS